ncbi:hypothetical protein DL93DRAFT_2072649 [Clavulina sp. PMI_390]|nr:hypothetical protein DL93DRAFT_2072649 [Clavulina sp. PMI_390]
MGDTTTTAATSIWATPADSPPNAPLIALDLDDVLMATNSAIARWHTKNYSPITIEDFHYVSLLTSNSHESS